MKCIKMYGWMSYFFSFSVCGGVLLVQPAQAVSFDCAKAQSSVEHLICDSSELSKLDDEMAARYKAALQNKTTAEAIKQAQKMWLKERNRCADVACTQSAYTKRLALLAIHPGYGFCDETHNANMYSSTCGTGQIGKGYAICEAFLKHVNTLQEIPPCEAPVPPGFSRPEWEELDVLQHLDWAYWIDIQQGGPGGYVPPDFESWRKVFLEKLQAGKIAPHMRKARIRPVGKEEITVLAYTGDRLSCQRGMNQESLDYLKWNRIGYAYHELTTDAAQPLSLGNRRPTDLLLFAGKPYLFQVFKYDGPSFDIHHFVQLPRQYSGQSVYVPAVLCQILPFQPSNQVLGNP